MSLQTCNTDVTVQHMYKLTSFDSYTVMLLYRMFTEVLGHEKKEQFQQINFSLPTLLVVLKTRSLNKREAYIHSLRFYVLLICY